MGGSVAPRRAVRQTSASRQIGRPDRATIDGFTPAQHSGDAMRTLVDQLAHYAAYHRDRRNIATHFIGIPMIVFSVAVLLARVGVDAGGVHGSAAAVAAIALALYHLRLDLRFGLAMGVLLALAVAGANAVAALPTAAWAAWGVGLFVVGWVWQFVGHYYEGRKPAFVDDLSGLAVGPLFVVAEAAFALGLRSDVREAVERRAGPMRSSRPHAARV
jgi:uncharacterized membrane protein YGL010W